MNKSAAPTPVRAVIRAVDLLFALTAGSTRLGDLSAQVGLSKATTYRLLVSLRASGMVMQDQESGEYNLGPASFRLVTNLLQGSGNILPYARPIMDALREETGETVAIHVRIGATRMCIEELPSPHPLRFVAGIGESTGINVGAAGKVLLAFLPAAERDKVLSTLRPEAMTDATVVDVDQLRDELVEVARTGVSISYGERVAGAVGVSAPIMNDRGFAEASLSVLGPTDRMDAAVLRKLEGMVRSAATQIADGIFPAAGE